MSKYIATIPLADIERIAIVTGNGRSMAQVKGDADYICNAGFYDMTTGKPVDHLKVDGTVLSRRDWGCWGFAWAAASCFPCFGEPSAGRISSAAFFSRLYLSERLPFY